MLTKDTLQKSLEEAGQAVQSREAELARAQEALGEAERELALLGELAQLRGVALPASLQAPETARTERATGTSGSQSRRTGSKRTSALIDAVIEILDAAGEPVQIQDLMAAVKERPVRIPGQGAQANLIAVISRDLRIVRPRRGFYGLSDWGLKDQPRNRTRKPKSRR